MKPIVTVFIAFFSLLASAYRTTAQNIHFKIIESPKDMNWGLVTAMTQDSTGFLWLATWNGFYRYDGSRYTAYNHNSIDPNSLASDRTECVFADKDRYIYIGTYGSGLDQMNPLTGTFKHFINDKNNPHSLSSDTVTAITKGRNGLLWVGTVNGLNNFDPSTGKCKRFLHDINDSASISENHIRVVYEDREGVVWIGTKGPFVENGISQVGGLNRFDPETGKFTRYLHSPNNPLSLINNTVTAIFEDSRGNLMIGTAGDGLHIMNRRAGTFQRLPYDANHPENMSRPPVLDKYAADHVDHISFITEDKLGNIWIGTMENGINVYDPVKKMTIHFGAGENNINKLKNDEFWRAFKSREGIMWVGSWSGNNELLNLYQINPFEYKLPRTEVGYFPMSFLENEDKSLWIGTDSCLIKKNPDGSQELYPLKVDGKVTGGKNYVFCVLRQDKENLWLDPVRGLHRFNTTTKKFTSYFRQDNNPASLGCDSVYIITEGSENKLWVGTGNGLDLLDIPSGIFTHFKHNPNDTNSISNNYIGDLRKLKNGDLLIGSDNVIDRMDTKTGNSKHYKVNGFVQTIVEDPEGNIWTGTDHGLYRYDEGKQMFVGYTDYPDILNSGTVIFKMAMDVKQNLMIATYQGFIKLNMQSNEISTYGSNIGMIPADYVLRNLYLRKNGEVLISDNSGYFHFEPDNSLKKLPKTTVLITGFSVSDDVVVPGPGSVLTKPIFETVEISLKYNENNFSFTYSVIDYTERDAKTPLLYMLENYDVKWRKANADYNASYYNVPPGRYIFKVKSTNSTGLWVVKDLTIIVRPPWWKTIWAYIFYSIVFIILTFFVNRMIRKRIIENEKSKHREKELAHAKEIEKAYHELKLTQVQLIQSEKMASLGQLTAGIAHEIQNPLNFVNNFSDVNKELLSEMRDELNKGNIEEAKAIAKDVIDNEDKINQHGKRADSVVKGMLQHSKTSSSIKEPTDINALADEYLRLSYHGIRAKHKSFNAALQTNFDSSIEKINIVPQDIGRVLLNLYNNAFYAVNEKQHASRASLPVLYEPTVSVSTRKEGKNVIISVKDNGNGVPENIVAKIFQPFFTTKPTGQGTGLGLSLSYDIVKAHGGEIKINTKEGEETEFVVRLPG